MRNQPLKKWLLERAQRWKTIDELQRGIEKGRHGNLEDIVSVSYAYREMGHDLALAQRHIPDSGVVAQLKQIYAGLHRSIYRRNDRAYRDLIQVIKTEIPLITSRLKGYIFWVSLLFIFSTGIGWLMVDSFPELAALFASNAMIDQVENGQLWTDGLLNVTPSSLLSVGILTNNIVVALTACCLGFLFGLGTLYIIILNGLMLGSIFAFTHQYSLAGRLFEFVIAHGIVELSAICISGAVGASIGEALVRPGKLSRRAAFESASKQGMKLMLVIVIFLFGAGFIEGYVSPNAGISLGTKISVGVVYMLIFVYTLVGPRNLRA